MRLLLAAVLLVACAEASAQSQPGGPADGSSGRILLVTPTPHLGVDLPGFERGAETLALPSEPETAAGPRGRGAWRGAKTGFLVGAGLGAIAVGGALLYDSQGGCDMFCAWMIAGAVAVPFTAITTATGAAIGAATARRSRETLAAPDPNPADVRP